MTWHSEERAAAWLAEYLREFPDGDTNTFADFVVAQLCAEPGLGPAPIIGWYHARAAYLSNDWAKRLRGEHQEESQTTSDVLELELEHWQESQQQAATERVTSVELEAGQLEITLSGAVTMLVVCARKFDALARALAEQRARGDAGMRFEQAELESAILVAGIVGVGLEAAASTLSVFRSVKKEC